jgi:hypothetical protein
MHAVHWYRLFGGNERRIQGWINANLDSLPASLSPGIKHDLQFLIAVSQRLVSCSRTDSRMRRQDGPLVLLAEKTVFPLQRKTVFLAAGKAWLHE